MDRVIEKIKGYFDDNDWKYKYDGRSKRFSFGVRVGDAVGDIDMFIFVNKTDYLVSARLNAIVNEEKLDIVSKFLHDENYGLKNGNFELNTRDGIIKYKSYVNFKNSDISEEIIEDSIMVPIVMIGEKGKDIIKLLLD